MDLVCIGKNKEVKTISIKTLINKDTNKEKFAEFDNFTSLLGNQQDLEEVLKSRNLINFEVSNMYLAYKYRGETKKTEIIYNNPKINNISNAYIEGKNNIKLGVIQGLLDDLLLNYSDTNIRRIYNCLLTQRLRNSLETYLNNYEVTQQEQVELESSIRYDMIKSYKLSRDIYLFNKKANEYKHEVVALRTPNEEQQRIAHEHINNIVRRMYDPNNIRDYSAQEAYRTYHGDIDMIYQELGLEKLLSLSDNDLTILGFSRKELLSYQNDEEDSLKLTKKIDD